MLWAMVSIAAIVIVGTGSEVGIDARLLVSGEGHSGALDRQETNIAQGQEGGVSCVLPGEGALCETSIEAEGVDISGEQGDHGKDDRGYTDTNNRWGVESAPLPTITDREVTGLPERHPDTGEEDGSPTGEAGQEESETGPVDGGDVPPAIPAPLRDGSESGQQAGVRGVVGDEGSRGGEGLCCFIATRYGGGPAYGDTIDYNGGTLGCSKAGTYSSYNTAILAVSYSRSAEWGCGTRLLICTNNVQLPVQAGAEREHLPTRCISVERSDTCPGCGHNHLDLSEEGIRLLCGYLCGRVDGLWVYPIRD